MGLRLPHLPHVDLEVAVKLNFILDAPAVAVAFSQPPAVFNVVGMDT